MIEDAELLSRYAEEHSEAAFAELVRRRVDLVYAVARRQCGGDAQLAEEVTQRVFADLARKAKTLAGRMVISGWLYRSVHFAASDAVRAERRRRVREQEDFLMKEATTGPGGGRGGEESVGTERLRPLLDAALGELREADRDAVALRFLEERSWAEVAGALGLREDAARKRVARALDALQGLLARRGITSTAAALGVALGGQAGVAAPAGLAASVTSGAMAGMASGAGVVGSFLAFMSTAKTVGVVAVVAVGLVLFEARALREARRALGAASLEVADLRAKVRALERQLVVQSQRAMEADEDAELLLNAVQAAEAARPDSVETAPITQAAVDVRYKRAQLLARNGQPVEALKDFLWCFDRGMVEVSFYSGVRVTGLLAEIAELGKTHPAALEALRVRRDAAERAMEADAHDARLALVFGAINHALKENERTLAFLDRLPTGDQRRSVLGSFAFVLLAERGSYADAARARPFPKMLTAFDQGLQRAGRKTVSVNDEKAPIAGRSDVIIGTVRNIEVLAGAGELDYAREMIARLLVYDGGTETRERLRQRLVKVGRVELMPGGR